VLPYLLTSSDDMLIKLWDWDKGWACVQVFEGHSHYVMQVRDVAGVSCVWLGWCWVVGAFAWEARNDRQLLWQRDGCVVAGRSGTQRHQMGRSSDVATSRGPPRRTAHLMLLLCHCA
jgi:WD40 repeat protein